MGLEAFIGIAFSAILGGFGYLLVRKDSEDKDWRARMEKKVDDIPRNIMLELGNYVQMDNHNADIRETTNLIAQKGREIAELERRVSRVESQLELR